MFLILNNLMRILLTDQGKDLVTILTEENSQETEKKVLATENSKVFSIKPTHKSPNRSRNFQNTQASSNRSRNESFENAKQVDVKIKKITISKNITEKYNNDTRSNYILTNLPDLIQKNPTANTTTNNNKTSSSVQKQSKLDSSDLLNCQFSLKEIIPQKTYSKLKNQLKRDIHVRNKNGFIDQNHFRSIYKEKSEPEVLEEKLQSRIPSDRLNIIKYLSSKPNINYHFVQNLTSFDEERLNKLNKICQKVFDSDEKNELFQKIVSEKINIKRRKDLAEYKEKFETLSNFLGSANEIKNAYNLPKNVRINKFGDLHDDIKKKYWTKHSIDKLSRTKEQNRLYNETSSFGNSTAFH